jgi:AcrR family transcriptional regulator
VDAQGGATDEDPRIARSRRRVLDAAQAVLCEHGMRGATIEGIAARCGVAKTTIYRHWHGREDLIAEAVDCNATGFPKPEATGDLRTDLVAWLTTMTAALESPHGQVLAALVDGAERDPRLAEVQRRFADERRAWMVGQLEVAVTRGQLPADTDLALLVDQVVGPLMYRRFLCRHPVDARWIDEHVTSILTRPPRLADP